MQESGDDEAQAVDNVQPLETDSVLDLWFTKTKLVRLQPEKHLDADGGDH